MLAVLIMLLLPSLGEVVVTDSCDYAEFNTVLREDGTVALKQVVFWEWRDFGPTKNYKNGLSKSVPGFVVVEYRIIVGLGHKDKGTPTILQGKKGKVLLFWDHMDNVMRKVNVGWITHTTGADSEQRSLREFPSKFRRGLYLPK